ncbi:Cell division protein FtsQ [Alloactinosynnema sp. L-07]|uniref:cell division protein FtsQ/DivIB n=1 Tax=Alloactinosynnema sp. L-07 TaxID=1653480 RepID=UPI00065EFD8A|nr:FtsQ-type POTRA domain-containing protein [Alloactinosynnema sp. L-07]CRK58424.1 Cell division protein FtsQ [Alloactinosynnema sp. L-07]
MTSTGTTAASISATRRRPRQTERPVTRGRYLMRRWAVLGGVLGVLGLLYVVLFTSVLGVRGVEVLGNTVLTADEVRDAAKVEPDSPLVRLDTDAIAARVAALPRVRSVDVRRSFPSTVEIIIVERSAVAVAIAPDGFHLVDGAGVDYSVETAAPPGLPQVTAPDPATTKAAVEILAAVPEPLRPQVVSVVAETVGNVRLTLTDGRVVKWGGTDESARKAAVLGPLLTRPGKTYDVATPDFPTVA